MFASEVIGFYHELWHVEQSFRISKTDQRARPIFVRTRDAIEAHPAIVFTALAVSREVQVRTGLAIRNVIKQLRSLRWATIAINGRQQTIDLAIPPRTSHSRRDQTAEAQALNRMTELRQWLGSGLPPRPRLGRSGTSTGGHAPSRTPGAAARAAAERRLLGPTM